MDSYEAKKTESKISRLGTFKTSHAPNGMGGPPEAGLSEAAWDVAAKPLGRWRYPLKRIFFFFKPRTGGPAKSGMSTKGNNGREWGGALAVHSLG